MAALSTGPILNTGATAAVSIVVELSNDNTTQAASVELELFAITVSATGSTKTPVAHQLFSVPPNSVVTRSFSIQGLIAYEVQFNTSGTALGDLIIDTFALAANGDLVAAERVLQSEITAISAITPA